MSVPKLFAGFGDSGMSSDMSVMRMPDGQPSPDGETLSGNSSNDEGISVPERKMGRSVMFSPGERRDGRRVSACAARNGLGVRVAALREGINVTGLRVGTCVTAGMRVATSGVVAVGRNEIKVPITALLAPPGLVVLVGAAVGTAVCVLLGSAITLLLCWCDGSGVATTTGGGAAVRSVGAAVRS
jgi:hypothetical protein